MTIITIGTNVCIELNPRRTVSETGSGIVFPENYSEAEAEGTITSAGRKVEHVKVGDVVGFPRYAGTRMEHGGKEWVIVDESKLLYVR